MENKDVLVSIITVNYKQPEVTNQLLESLDQISWKNFEVIIVDNGSGDSGLNKINTRYKWVKLIPSKINLGFAGGNNLGIRFAKGQYILLLNNDTTVEPSFIEYMLWVYATYKDAGAVSPLIKYYDQPDTIQYAGFTSMHPFTFRMNAIGHKQKDLGQYTEPEETNFAHGCAMMIPRKVMDEVGLMDESYFLYYEEHDWSTRIKKAGYKIYFQPQSIVYHKESVSTVKNSTLKTYFLNRNRILYMVRNSPFLHQVIGSIYLLFISIPKNILGYIVRREKSHLKAYWDAIIWNLTHHTKPQWKR